MVVDDHESVWVETMMLRNRRFNSRGRLIHGEPKARGGFGDETWSGNLGCYGEGRGSLGNEVKSASLADSANLELGSLGCLRARLLRHWFTVESLAGSMTAVGLWVRRG
jgi:hypothetical protein